jgi:hypothetical protein
VAATEGQGRPRSQICFKCETFSKMPGQNTIKVIKKHSMTRKVRIMVWQEERYSVTDMADLLGRLCCQDFSNVYLAAPSGSMQMRINVSSRVMVTGPKTDSIHYFLFLSSKKMIFCYRPVFCFLIFVALLHLFYAFNFNFLFVFCIFSFFVQVFLFFLLPFSYCSPNDFGGYFPTPHPPPIFFFIILKLVSRFSLEWLMASLIA